MTHGQSIPFDLKDVRTVFYDLHDPDKLEAAQTELAQKARAIEENSGEVRNPITVARDVNLLQQSDDPETQVAGAVLSAVNDLRDEVRAIGRRIDGASTRAKISDYVSPATAESRIRKLFRSDGASFTVDEVASRAGAPPDWIKARLTRLVDEGVIFRVGEDRYTSIPF